MITGKVCFSGPSGMPLSSTKLFHHNDAAYQSKQTVSLKSWIQTDKDVAKVYIPARCEGLRP